jgi:Fe-Mn family superoxide dismutase
VRNNGGGHWNHSLFWELMAPNAGGAPGGAVGAAIDAAFGDFAKFRDLFKVAAVGRFGSGWAWLVAKPDGTVAIESSPNQDNPLMEGRHAILGLDVWEHAYYLRYQNRRPDYIEAWWNVVNWGAVEARYAARWGPRDVSRVSAEGRYDAGGTLRQPCRGGQWATGPPHPRDTCTPPAPRHTRR